MKALIQYSSVYIIDVIMMSECDNVAENRMYLYACSLQIPKWWKLHNLMPSSFVAVEAASLEYGKHHTKCEVTRHSSLQEFPQY